MKSLPILVAINGIEGAGKTTFAREWVDFLVQNSRKAIHVSIDGFHHDRERRYRQGRDSARGYYEDSYDEQGFVDHVLKRSQSNSPSYVPATHDLETDEYLELAPISLLPDSILVVDGAYLLKPIYNPHWDLGVYLKVDFEVAMQRGIERDQARLGGEDPTRMKYLNRYHAASRIYVDEVNPEQVADVVIEGNDFENLRILKGLN